LVHYHGHGKAARSIGAFVQGRAYLVPAALDEFKEVLHVFRRQHPRLRLGDFRPNPAVAQNQHPIGQLPAQCVLALNDFHFGIEHVNFC